MPTAVHGGRLPPALLARYAPKKSRDSLAGGNCEITYLLYIWGLNDQGTKGKEIQPDADDLESDHRRDHVLEFSAERPSG